MYLSSLDLHKEKEMKGFLVQLPCNSKWEIGLKKHNELPQFTQLLRVKNVIKIHVS